jgi:hypothetical protein
MSDSSEGKHFRCDCVDVIAVTDGRVARKDTYLDWPAIERQLGTEEAMPTPEPRQARPRPSSA